MSNHSPNVVDPHEVTQFLKDVLNVGKTQQPTPPTEVGLANLSGSSLNGKTVADGMAGLHEPQTDTDVIPCADDNNTYTELLSSPQVIAPQGNDEQTGFSIHSRDVTVLLRQNNHTSGSSKIEIQNIVNYGWDHKMYVGKLVCVHLSGTFIAYTLKASASTGGVVRVFNYSSGERILIKGMKGQVKDLSFAHISSQIILACVDDTGALFVYEIIQKDKGLFSECLLHVESESELQKSDYHRVIWCPYIPEDPSTKEDPSDMSKLLVVTHGSKAEMWDLERVTKEYGSGLLMAESVKFGVQRIIEHEMPITDATFAPDGSALATASLDGEVKFFQVQGKNQDSGPKCLHRWEPHARKPLSCIFFLDNHKNPLPDVQFWKFAITGAENNREIKVWSCETWNCLQTIRFASNGELGQSQPCLKAEMDLSSGYLLLSEINRKFLYVLQLTQNPLSTYAHVTSLTEFPLSSPVLSLAVISANRCKFKLSMGTEHIDKMTNDCSDDYGMDGEEDLTTIEKYVEGTVLKTFWINTKSLQMSRIVYQSVEPSSAQLSSSLSTISQDSSISRDRLSDLSTEVQDAEQKSMSDNDVASGDVKLNATHPCSSAGLPSAYFVHSSKSPLSAHNQSFRTNEEILLTPDDFTSSPSTAASTISTPYTSANTSVVFPLTTPSEDLSYVATTKPDSEEDVIVPVYAEDSDFPLSSDGGDSARRKFSQHSSTSSPSQEVADIMAPKKRSIHEHMEKGDDDAEMDGAHLESTITDQTFLQTTVVPNPSLLKQPASNAINSVSSKEWPDVPIPYKEFERTERANSYPSAVLKHPTPSGNILLDTPMNPTLQNHTLLNVDFEEKEEKCMENKDISNQQGTLDTISNSLAVLMELVKKHDVVLKDIQSQMQEYSAKQQAVEKLEHRIGQLEDSLLTKLDRSVSLQMQKELDKVDCSLSKREELDKQWFEKQSSVLSHTFMTSLNSKIEKAIKTEVKGIIAPQVTKFLDVWKDQVQQDLAQKLSPTDTYIRESVARLSKNKAFMDSFGSSLAYSIQTHTQNASREVFQNVVIPSFEKACHMLFSQLNEAFQKGTHEYLQGIKSHQESSWKVFSSNIEKVLLTCIEDKINSLKTAMEQTIQTRFEELTGQLKQQQSESLNQFQESMNSNLKATLVEELNSLAWGHQGPSGPASITARSRAVTPAAHQMLDPQVQQQHIMQLLRQGHLNSAFQQALSASNLSLVVAVCEAMSPSQVFNQQPCPLQQPVLLSLIQQLAADLNSHTELKLKYIQEAMMNLDTTNPITREHMTAVLRSLVHKLSVYLQNNPQNSNTRHVRMLLIVAQSVMTS